MLWRVNRGLVVAAAIALMGSSVSAQTRPDAGMLRQQIENERTLEMPKKVAPEKPAEPPPLKALSGVSVTVLRFRFAGNHLLSDQQLSPAVESFLNRPLDFAELQSAAAAIGEIYHEAGWVVRSYLPQQEIVGGEVTIQIIEAVLGRIQIEGEPPRRANPADILAIIEDQQPVGAPLNTRHLDRALLLADDLPGVAVTGALGQGTSHAETDLTLKISDKPLLTGDISSDNTGSRSTGAVREVANATLNSVLRSNDQLNANAIHTDGSDYVRLAATAPFGSDGLRFGANASYLVYRLVTVDFASLGGSGDSASAGLEANYPILRGRLENLYFSLALDHKTFANKAGGIVTSRYAIDESSLGFNGNLYDNWLGGGSNSVTANLIGGRLDLGGSPNQEADARTVRTAGGYGKTRASLSRLQVLSEDMSFFATASGQLANKNLDSSEKFNLGGPTGVRAYPANEGGGSEGTLVNIELRSRLPADLAGTAFFDSGHIIINQNNRFFGAPAQNGYSLRGAGLALAWTADFGLNLKAVWAHRIGANPDPTPSGRDQDGSLDLNRWWLTASLAF